MRVTAKEYFSLVEALESSPDRAERLNAACRLGSWGAGGTAAILVKALQREQEAVVREAIMGSLLLCDAGEVVQEVAPLLKSDDPTSRSLALEILTCKVEDRAAGVLEQLLQDGDRDVRVLAVHVLGRSRYSGSLDLLRQVVQREEDINVACAALEYIGELGRPGDRPLVESCRQRFRHPYMEFIATKTLQQLQASMESQQVEGEEYLNEPV
ncbi:HEAT repeat protein [Neomoorella glycerini]|uniref:HEAT repeat protein n=1 Tax=Neomoorella glycerini TaxID=55779 RepID=A0A6I5ZLV6_9FIRM|nr:HEAT repeat domain-containing protein [Moorella glycerini]QGP90880.1 HEAT repeat protein [Moorella glycerini]